MAKYEFEVIEGPTTITPPVDMVLLHKADYERLSTEGRVNKAVVEIAREIIMHWGYEKPNCKISAVIDADYISRLENAFDEIASVSGTQEPST